MGLHVTWTHGYLSGSLDPALFKFNAALAFGT